MKEYLKVYRYLNIPQREIDIAMGKLKLPFDTIEQPAINYGFPPALIPLWTETNFYYGYWKHWFVEGRSRVFVRMLVESGYKATEAGEDLKQYIYQMILEYIAMEDELDSKIIKFAKMFGINKGELEKIKEISEEYGDDPQGLITLPNYQEKSPLICCEDGNGYKLNFPNESMKKDEASLKKTCGSELSNELRKQIAQIQYAPIWLKSNNQKENFDQLLDKKDYSGAWLSLNSSKWNFCEAKKAMELLAREVKDKGFDLLAEAWTSLDFEQFVEY